MNEYYYGEMDKEWDSLRSKDLWQKRAELESEVRSRVLARTKQVTALEKELREAQASEQKLLADIQAVAEENKELEERLEKMQQNCFELHAKWLDLQAENFELKRPWYERVWFSLLDRIPFRIVWR